MEDRFDSFDLSYTSALREAAEDAEKREDEEIRQQIEARQAQLEAEQQAIINPPEEAPALEAAPEEEEDGLAPSRGFFSDAAAGLIGGIRDAGVNTAQLGIDVATLGQSGIDLDEAFPDVDDRDSATFNVVQGLTQFATGFVPAIGIMGRLGKAAAISKKVAAARNYKIGRVFTGVLARDTAAGAIADVAVFDPHSARFSDFVNEQGLGNPITEWLASEGNEDDSFLVGRMKNVIEGAGLGAAIDVVFRGLRFGKNNLQAYRKTIGNNVDPIVAHDVKNTHEAVVIDRQALDEIDRAIELQSNNLRPATDPNVDAARQTLDNAAKLQETHPDRILPAYRDPETGEIVVGGRSHADLLPDTPGGGLDLQDADTGFWDVNDGRWLTREEAAQRGAADVNVLDFPDGEASRAHASARAEAAPVTTVVQPHAEAQAHIDAARLKAGPDRAALEDVLQARKAKLKMGDDYGWPKPGARDEAVAKIQEVEQQIAALGDQSPVRAALEEHGAPFDEAARQASGIEQARAIDSDRVARLEQKAFEAKERMLTERAEILARLAESENALAALRTSAEYRKLPKAVREEWEKINDYSPVNASAADEVDQAAKIAKEANPIDEAAEAELRAANEEADRSLAELDQDDYNLYDEGPNGQLTINEDRVLQYHMELNKDGSTRKINIGKQLDMKDPVIFRAVTAIFARARGSVKDLDVKSLAQIHRLNNFNRRRMTGPGGFKDMADELATFVREHLGLSKDTVANKETLREADAMARQDATQLGDPARANTLLQNYRKAFKDKAQDLRVSVTVIRIMTESARLEAHRLVREVLASNSGTISQADLVLAFDNFVQLQNIRDGFAAEIGRALQSFNIKVHAVPVLNDLDASRIVDGMGGVEAIRTAARQMEGALNNDAALEKIVKGMRAGPMRLRKMAIEYWLNAILSGPITQTVNLFSNTAVMLWAPAEKALIGAVRKGLTGDDLGLINQAVREYQGLSEGWRAAFRLSAEGQKAVWESVTGQIMGKPNATLAARLRMAEQGDDVGNVWKAFAGDEAQIVPGASQYDIGDEVAISSGNVKRRFAETPLLKTLVKDLDADTTGGRLIDWIGNATRLPGRLLTTGDELAKTLNYHMSLNRLAYDQAIAVGAENVDMYVKELVQNVPKHRTFGNLEPDVAALYEQLDEASKAYARKYTFTEPLSPGTIGKDFQNFVTKHPTARLAVPFVRTPTNLLYFAAERSPLLWKHSKAYKDAFATMGQGFKDTPEYAVMRGRMMIGSALYMTAGLAAYNGILTGAGPGNSEERAALFATGWMPNSIRFTNDDGSHEYVSYNRTDPFGLFLGMAATLAEGIGQMGDQDIIDVTVAMSIALSETLQSKAYFSGIVTLVSALDNPDRSMKTALKKYVGSLVPNFIGSTNRTGVFPTDMGPMGLPKDDLMREAEGFLDTIMAKLPGYSATLPARRNVFGEPITYAMGLGPDTFSPFQTRSSPNDPVNREIARLVPFGLGISMNGYKQIKGMELTPQQRDRYIQLSTGDPSRNGSDLRDGLRRLFESRRYQNADDSPDGKQQMIKDFIRDRRERGARALLREDTELHQAIRAEQRKARHAAVAKREAAEKQTPQAGMDAAMAAIMGSNS